MTDAVGRRRADGRRREHRPVATRRPVGTGSRPLPGEAIADPASAIADALVAGDDESAGAFVRRFADAASAEASTQTRTLDARPLRGVSLAVKDNVAIAGFPLGAGSRQREGQPPEWRDAAILAELRGHGAIPVGAAALHEFALGVTGINAYAGTPLHPVDPGRLPGGSSSGSAVAVANGAAVIGIGTDTAGSVRIPAALCGVVGFKPSYNEYPTSGVYPLSYTLDHVGLIGKDVTTLRRSHAVLTGEVIDVALPRRVAVIEEHLGACDPEVRDRVRWVLDLLSDAGVEVGTAAWPGIERSAAASTFILLPEAAAVHRDALAGAPERFGPDVRKLLAAGARVDPAVHVAALEDREVLRAEVGLALQSADLVIGPTVGVVAPQLADAGQPEVSARLLAFTCLLNVVGVPALTLPLPGAGLPVGIQLVSTQSASLLAMAAAIESMVGSA